MNGDDTQENLLDAMRSCSVQVADGLPQGAQACILMALVKDMEDALAYIAHEYPTVVLAGCCFIRSEFSLYHLDSLSRTDLVAPREPKNIPLLLPEDFALFPEAIVLVYSPHHLYEGSRLLRCAMSCSGYATVWPAFAGRPGTSPSPGFCRANRKNLEWVFARLADSRSRRDLAALIKAHVTGIMGYIKLAPFESYMFPPALCAQGDIVIDGGIGSLWPLTTFAAQVGVSGKCYGFEPNPEAFDDLRDELKNLPESSQISLIPLGLFSHKGTLTISLHGGASRLVGEEAAKAGMGATIPPSYGKSNEVPCRVTDLDSFVVEQNLSRVDVIKLDIEGAEAAALKGMEKTLRRFRPRLMIAAYHNGMKDLLILPRLLDELCPGYRLYFAAHHMCHLEFLLYAIPDSTGGQHV